MDENVEKLREYLCTIRKALSCYQCKKICIEPWIIRCGHNFCKKCIQDLRNLDRNCPRCVLQPITRRGVRQNEELEKVITQFHNFEDAFKADTRFDVTQDGFVPSHIIYGSKSFEHSLPKSPLNNVEPISGQDSNKAPGRKNSVPDTEYFRRYKSLTFRKDRIVSDKSPTRDNERNFVEVEVEGRRDEEEGLSLSHHVSEDKRLLTKEKQIRKAADDREREQENEEEQNVAEEQSLRLSSHEASRTESDEGLEEQSEEQQNGSEVGSLRLSSHETSRVESDESLEEQKEEEQNVVEEQSLRLSSHEASRTESDEGPEEQNEEHKNVTGERNLRLPSYETSRVESDECLEEQNEEEQNVAKERSLRLSNHEASRNESDKCLEEQNEEEQNISEERSLSLSSHKAPRVESDQSLKEQNEEEQNGSEVRSLSLSSHESSRSDSDSLEKQNEEAQNGSEERNLSLSSHEASRVESDKTLEEQNEEEQNVSEEKNLSLSSHEASRVESDRINLEEQNEEEQNGSEERSLSLSSHESSRSDSNSLEKQNEEEQNGSEERSLSLSSHEASRTESDGLEKENEEEQNGSEERNLSLSSHEASRVESDKISFEEQNEDGQSLSHEPDQVESHEDEYTDSLEESPRSSSHNSDEIKPYKVEELSIKKELPYSDNELYTQDMDIKPLENFEVSDSNLHKSKRFDPIPGLVKTTSQSNTETEPLEESVIFLESADAEKKSSNSNHTVDLVSPHTFDSQNVHKILVRKRKTLDRVSNPSKAAKLNKIKKKVLFLYCGKLSRHHKSLVDKDIVTVLSPAEMKSNLAKKSPMNRNLLDFGFKRLRGNLNSDTSKVNENSLLGKRKRSVSKATNVLENVTGDEGTRNVDEVFLNHSGTTEDLSDFRNKLENNLDKRKPSGSSRNRSIISESELTTESFSTRQIKIENQKAGEKLKMQEIHSASGIIDSLQAQGEFLNLDFNKKNRVEEQNQLKAQLLSYEMKTTQIVSELFVNRVEDSHQRPIEQLRASAEEDMCESFHIEKFLAFNKESEDACTFEDEGDDHADEKLILPSDGSKTPTGSFFLEKKNKPSRGIVAESGVIILSSDDDMDSSKEQDYLGLPDRQEPSTLSDESDTKIKTPRGVRRTNDNSLGWRIKKKIAKE